MEHFKEVIRNRIIELKTELEWLQTEMIENPRCGFKVKKRIETTKDLIELNFTYLDCLESPQVMQ